MSKRAQILAAVKARFAAITVAGGYQTDVGLKQTVWHLTPKEPVDMPGHDVRDEVETPGEGDTNSGHSTRRLQIAVVGEMLEGAEDAANARKMLADFVKAVGVDQTWGGLARRTESVEEDVTVDEEGQRIGGARLVMIVVYGRKPWEA